MKKILVLSTIAFFFLFFSCSQNESDPSYSDSQTTKLDSSEIAMKEDIQKAKALLRLGPQEVLMKMKENDAILVCAYDDDSKYEMAKLAGSISYGEFKNRLPSFSKDQQIVFYCA